MTDVTLRAFIEDKVSRQQFLDFVYTKLKEQGRKAYADERCLYNAPDGAHCGIGWTILNETDYQPREGSSVYEVVKDLGLCKRHMPNLEFIEKVQRAHDETSTDRFMSDLRDNFTRVAHRFMLIPPK